MSVQQELLPRVSLNVGYNRRWFQNFFVTTTSSSAPPTTPVDLHRSAESGAAWRRRLTGHDLFPPSTAIGAQNYQTFETDFAPARTQYWHGVNVDLNARLRSGLTLQGGTTTGRGVRDTCATQDAARAILGTGRPVASNSSACDVTEPWMTSSGALPLHGPKVDVLVSANCAR